jgi:hypothetical protein
MSRAVVVAVASASSQRVSDGVAGERRLQRVPNVARPRLSLQVSPVTWCRTPTASNAGLDATPGAGAAGAQAAGVRCDVVGMVAACVVAARVDRDVVGGS